MFINEPRLSDFKQVLNKAGIQAEFAGGVLICNNVVCVRRVSTDGSGSFAARPVCSFSAYRESVIQLVNVDKLARFYCSVEYDKKRHCRPLPFPSPPALPFLSLVECVTRVLKMNLLFFSRVSKFPLPPYSASYKCFTWRHFTSLSTLTSWIRNFEWDSCSRSASFGFRTRLAV